MKSRRLLEWIFHDQISVVPCLGCMGTPCNHRNWTVRSCFQLLSSTSSGRHGDIRLAQCKAFRMWNFMGGSRFSSHHLRQNNGSQCYDTPFATSFPETVSKVAWICVDYEVLARPWVAGVSTSLFFYLIYVLKILPFLSIPSILAILFILWNLSRHLI